MAKPREEATIDDQLRDYMLATDETAGEIGRRAGVHESVIRRYLGKHRDITLGTAARLATALGVQFVKVKGRR